MATRSGSSAACCAVHGQVRAGEQHRHCAEQAEQLGQPGVGQAPHRPHRRAEGGHLARRHDLGAHNRREEGRKARGEQGLADEEEWQGHQQTNVNADRGQREERVDQAFDQREQKQHQPQRAAERQAERDGVRAAYQPQAPAEPM
jgi:hypothetical protein